MPKLIRLRLTAAQREELFERQRRLPAASRAWKRLEMVRQADWGTRAPEIAERAAADRTLDALDHHVRTPVLCDDNVRASA